MICFTRVNHKGASNEDQTVRCTMRGEGRSESSTLEGSARAPHCWRDSVFHSRGTLQFLRVPQTKKAELRSAFSYVCYYWFDWFFCSSKSRFSLSFSCRRRHPRGVNSFLSFFSCGISSVKIVKIERNFRNGDATVLSNSIISPFIKNN